MTGKTICDAHTVEDQRSATARRVALPKPFHAELREAAWNVTAGEKRDVNTYADRYEENVLITLDQCDECFTRQLEHWTSDGGAPFTGTKAKWPAELTVRRL